MDKILGYYIIQNNFDGSSHPVFFHTKEDAQKIFDYYDQKDPEYLADDSVGVLKISDFYTAEQYLRDYVD